jgi:hypothetical protein
LVIDAEIRDLIPPPSAAEEAELERQLLAEGCRDPLVVWAGRRILLDGHTRLRLCLKHGLPFRVTEVHLPNREAAVAWVLARQGGRRNLSAEWRAYLRGRHYLRDRRAPGGTGANQHCAPWAGQNEHAAPSVLRRLAALYRVGQATLRRDARFAADVDALVAHCGAEVKGWALAADARLTRRDVAKLALLGPADQRQVMEQLRRDGRVSWPEEDDGERRLTVPASPPALARALLERLGRQRAVELARALVEALGPTDDATPLLPRGRRRS